MDGWFTAADSLAVAELWPDAELMEHDQLSMLLSVAQSQCAEFAPTVAAIPDSYRLAQVMQARSLWRSSAAGNDSQIGVDGQYVAVFPMDWTVKQLLRPKGVPKLG